MSANWLYYPFVIVLLALSFGAQEFVPAFEFAQQARFLLPPVVFFSSALSVSFPMMLLMAFFTGIVWDARNLPYKDDKTHAIVITMDAGIVSDVEKHPEVGGALPFGYTIFLFGALGTLMQGVRPLFKRGRWELPVLMVGVAIMTWLLVEYLLMSFLRGSFSFPYGMWTKLITDTLLAMLVSPVLLYLLHSIAHKLRFEAPQEGLTSTSTMVLKFQLRLYVLTLAVLVAFGALAERLWDLSVKRHDEFKLKVRGVKILRARIPGARGEIKDRNGVTLVANKSSFEVQVNLKMLVDDYKRQLAEDNRGKPKAQRREVPVVKYQYPDRGFIREKDELDIVSIVNDAIVEPLNALGLSHGFNAKQLRVQYRTNRGVVPWVYRSDLSFEEFSLFAEHRLGLSGLSVAERPVRQYLFDSLACHVLGYVNQADEKRVSDAERKEWDFFVPDDYGVYGVEKSFDADLRGRPGEVKLIQDERGHIIGEQERHDPMRGHDVWLTLDARVQYLAERALRESIPAIGRGAVVVLQPSTGEVLAMASVPSFNPNKFVPKISYDDFQAYTNNKVNPLFNRALEAYAPGSTYKVAISFAGILAGTEKEHFNCSGSVTYGNKAMHCWIAQKGGSHGMLGLSGGLKNSCNCFFFQYGNRAGIDNIAKAGHMFGLGEKTGIELEDNPGILPTRSWMRLHRPKEPFTAATVANISIGQGDVLATPLQMAGVAAAVGNGGICYRPHLMKYLKDDNDLVSEQKPDVRGNFSGNGMNKQKLELVRKGMWEVVNEEGGTGRGGAIKGVEVAGKTGTAEAWNPEGQKDNHTLFICFAPYVNPQYAVCILVEGGKSGGGCAAPVAKRILEQALNLDKGYTVVPAPVKEVVGNFNRIELVSFEGVAPNALSPNDQDNDTGTGGDEPPPKTRVVQEKPRAISANIRRDADEEGSRAVKKNQAPPPRPPGFFHRLFGH